MELSGKNFGIVIAYVLPGFALLYGLQPISPVLRGWLAGSPTIPASIESLFFVTVTSTAAGMTISALRWVLVDTLHHLTGLQRPNWDDANLQQNIDAFDVIVEAHYRYYQFYANTLIALFIAFVVARLTDQSWAKTQGPLVILIVTEVIFLAMSRDTLNKYYQRVSRLLRHSSLAPERRNIMGNGNSHGKQLKTEKPSKKPAKTKTKRK